MSRRDHLSHPAWLVTSLLLAAGCAHHPPRGWADSPRAFSHQFPDNDERAVVQVMRGQQRGGLASPSPTRPRLIGTTSAGSPRVVAFDLATGGELWTKADRARSRPIILGDLVLYSAGEPEHVVALDLESGQERWRIATDGLPFVGGSRAGNRLVLVASSLPPDVMQPTARRRSRRAIVWAVDARSGAVAWDHHVQGNLGRPASLAGYVFVPWDRQNLVVLSVQTGQEQARLRSTDDVIAWVRARESHVYFGGRGIYRFDRKAARGTQQEARYRPSPFPSPDRDADRSLPGDPWLEEDGFVQAPAGKSARGKIRLVAAPESGANRALTFADDRIYYTYFRYLFAYDAKGALKWASVFEHETVGALALRGGILCVDRAGTVRHLDPEGRLRWTRELDVALASAAVAGPDSALAELEPADTQTAAPPAPTLEEGLVQVAGDADARLTAAQVYAVRRLAERADSGPELTTQLVDLYGARTTQDAVRAQIATALRGSTAQPAVLVRALENRYDFLAGTEAPPVEALVPALVAAKAREPVPDTVIPLLARHLFDPATPFGALPAIVRGLVQLRTSQPDAVRTALGDFLRTYRADSAFASDSTALRLAAEGLFSIGHEEDETLLRHLARRSTTHSPLAEGIRELYELEARTAAVLIPTSPKDPKPGPLPARLASADTRDALAEQSDAFRSCLQSEADRNPDFRWIRAVFIVQNDGAVRDLAFVPDSSPLTTCVEAALDKVRFPPFRDPQMPASFVMRLVDSDPVIENRPQLDPSIPWWVRYRGRVDEPFDEIGEEEGAELESAGAWWLPEPTETLSPSPTDDASTPGPKPWWAPVLRPAGQNRSPEDATPADATTPQPGPNPP